MPQTRLAMIEILAGARVHRRAPHHGAAPWVRARWDGPEPNPRAWLMLGPFWTREPTSLHVTGGDTCRST